MAGRVKFPKIDVDSRLSLRGGRDRSVVHGLSKFDVCISTEPFRSGDHTGTKTLVPETPLVEWTI